MGCFRERVYYREYRVDKQDIVHFGETSCGRGLVKRRVRIYEYDEEPGLIVTDLRERIGA